MQDFDCCSGNWINEFDAQAIQKRKGFGQGKFGTGEFVGFGIDGIIEGAYEVGLGEDGIGECGAAEIGAGKYSLGKVAFGEVDLIGDAIGEADLFQFFAIKTRVT